MKTSPPDFPRRKGILTFTILAGGFGVAMLWALWNQFALGKGYPEATILADPADRYNDLTNLAYLSTLPNPYIDPIAIYPPTAFAFYRLLPHSDTVSLVLLDFLSLSALAFLLAILLRPIQPGAWSRVALAFLYLGLSYPLLYGLDRGNLEIVIAPLIAWALYCYARGRDLAGTAILFPAICFKLYPALFLVLLLRRRKAGLLILTVIAVGVILAISSHSFDVPSAGIWSGYAQNLAFYRDVYHLNNLTLSGSGAPWNTYKIALVSLQDLGLISPINFNYDGPLICASYRVYTISFAIFGLLCALYAWLYERHLARGILILLLFISIAEPSGADYRLMYASMALVLLATLPDRRRGDWNALVLLALAVIPKKEILLTYIGTSWSDYNISIQSILNPPCILAAMAILLYHARHSFDWTRTAQRHRDLLPWHWRWT